MRDRSDERDYEIEEEKCEVTIKREITIKFDDFELQFSFWENGERLGVEDDVFWFKDESETEERFLLRRMYCPVPRCGLGRAVLEFFKDIRPGSVIYTRPCDGKSYQDGSELTDKACKFVPKMQDLGLIEEWIQ